jgi:hypothetical protein
MLPRPGIDLLQERLDLLPKWSERIFDPHGHFWEYFPSDNTIQQLCWIVSFWRPARSIVRLPSHLRHNQKDVEVRTGLPFSKRRK